MTSPTNILPSISAMFTEHMKISEDEGFAINPPELVHLRSWHNIMINIVSASHFLKRIETAETKTGDAEYVFDILGMLTSFIMAYNRCFASSGANRVQLNSKSVYKDDVLRVIHNELVEMRNNQIAHDGESPNVLHTIAMRDDADRYTIRHTTTTVIPTDRLTDYRRVVDALDAHVVERMNRHLDTLGEKLGKIIIPEGAELVYRQAASE